jgi:hypothetical protein
MRHSKVEISELQVLVYLESSSSIDQRINKHIAKHNNSIVVFTCLLYRYLLSIPSLNIFNEKSFFPIEEYVSDKSFLSKKFLSEH